MTNLLSNVVFPSGAGGFLGLRGVATSFLEWVYSFIPNYGLAIIFFVLLLRLMFLPLDFGTKYFTKKNSMRMAEIKPEEEAIKAAHAGDPVAYNRARQALYKKHGYGMGGFCLFTLLNLVIMMVVFISVFQALNGISNFNINNQFKELQGTFHYHAARYIDSPHHITIPPFDTSEPPEYWIADFMDSPYFESWQEHAYFEDFETAINQRFSEVNERFLWVANVWRSDTPWTQRTLSWSDFQSAVSGVEGSVTRGLNSYQRAELQAEYNFIFGNIDEHGTRWNGILLLIILAGASTFLSSWINARQMAKNKPKPEEKKEIEAGYSIRDVKNQAGDGTAPQMPTIDPNVMTGKMMKFMLPVIMIVVTLMNTAALAIYITAGSLIATGLGVLMTMLVNKIIEKQKKKRAERGPDLSIINPHAKYFKTKNKAEK
ncbi:MAG: YidC/Oxa1 family membrane protein insertase [Firmicutes bacterium]|nr:YidC/Oxa1 family membrane protein insertase [Bacillota bacterium]